MSANYPVDQTTLRKQGTSGILSIVGGVGILVVSTLLQLPIVGWVISGGLAIYGISNLLKKSSASRGRGGIFLGAAAFGILAILPKSPVPWLLTVAGFGLVAFGGWNLFKYYKGLKSRS